MACKHDCSARDVNKASQISRRRAIVSSLGAIALGSGATLLPQQAALADASMTGADASDTPTSEDAEIVVWGESPDGKPGDGGTVFVSTTIRLRGDWHDIKLVSGLAWGNGHDGRDAWASAPKLAAAKAYRLRYTGILPHPPSPHEWYFTLMLEVADSKSDKCSALFRYIRHRGQNGVFSVSFPFPSHRGMAVDAR